MQLRNLAIAVLLLAAAVAHAGGKVRLMRVPEGGIQPQAAVDEKGVFHMVYLAGKPEASDIYYVRKSPGEESFSRPVRVNNLPGSAVAIGTVRGAHIAVGKNGRVHVAWMGSKEALPRGPGGETPMLYARMNDAKTGFEPQRNVLQFAVGLDGGASVAADSAGNVYVAWHGRGDTPGEENRRVWVARSTDEGRTFSREAAAFDQPTGACGCCGMRAFAAGHGAVHLLYRAAGNKVNRDMYLLSSTDAGKTFRGIRLHEWKIAACPMSTATIVRAGSNGDVLAAWETEWQVYFAAYREGEASAPIAAPGATGKRKHPVVAANSSGETILVWTEGTGWKKGGSLAWQVFDRKGNPTGEKGSADGVPVWSLAAVFAQPDGNFTIVY